MIYLRLHQARDEEIDPGASRGKQGNFAIVAKFLYNSPKLQGFLFTLYFSLFCLFSISTTSTSHTFYTNPKSK